MTPPRMTRYVAFLRGINVGGHKLIKMADLKKTVEAVGFRDVRTVLASGNVIFSAPSAQVKSITRMLQEGLGADLGHTVSCVVRSISDIEKLVDDEPFKSAKAVTGARWYVTFLAEKSTALPTPTESGPSGCKIVKQTGTEICMVLAPGCQTTDVMASLDKRLGRAITTRNWNTVQKILAAGR